MLDFCQTIRFTWVHMVILNRDCTEEADVSDPYFVFLVSGLVVCNIGSYFAKNGLHYWDVRPIVIQKTDDDERNMNTIKYSEAK